MDGNLGSHAVILVVKTDERLSRAPVSLLSSTALDAAEVVIHDQRDGWACPV